MYADEITESVSSAVDITNRRREMQIAYNMEHGITPRTIVKTLKEKTKKEDVILTDDLEDMHPDEVHLIIKDLKQEMKKAATKLDFENAARLRDRILVLEGASK
jgi:excinuclease ABC subunit B